MTHNLDTRAVLVWLVSSLMAVFVLDHPLIDVLAIAAAAAVAGTAGGPSPFRGFLKLGLIVISIRTVLFGLAGHAGTHVLFVVSEVHLPVWLGGTTLGGAVTAEVVLSSVAEGLRLVAVLAIFGAFISLTETIDLIRIAPRFMFELGLIVNISAGFAPEMVRTARDVREAQRMRGGSRRTLAPIVIPVVATALDRSIALAESMDSRGYGRNIADGSERIWRTIAAVAALTCVIATSVWATSTATFLSATVAGVGAFVTVVSLRIVGSFSSRTRYLRRRLGPRDRLTAIAAAVVAVSAVLIAQGGLKARFDPYSSITLAAPHPAATMVAACVALPVLLKRRTT